MDNKIAVRNNNSVAVISKDDFMRENSVPACMKKFNQVNSIEKAAVSGTMSLSGINRDYGREFVESYIQMWIININEFLNLSRMMSESQIIETSMLIYDDYYYLNIADIKMIFTEAKKGKYGNLYEGLDGFKILSWFKTYSESRFEMFESKIEMESANQNAIDRDVPRVSQTSHEKEVMDFKKVIEIRDQIGDFKKK